MVVTQPDLPRPAADWLKGRRRLEAASSGGPQPMAMARGGVFAGNDKVTQRNLSTSDLVSFASDALKSLQPALGVFLAVEGYRPEMALRLRSSLEPTKKTVPVTKKGATAPATLGTRA